MDKITVIIAEDHAVVRQGLFALLQLEKDIEVIGEAQDGRKAVELVKKLHPNVVVMDIGMPLLNGLEATRQITKSIPNTKVIILSAHSNEEYVRHAIKLGVSGYLLKQSTVQELSKAIRQVQKGKIFFSAAIADIPNLESKYIKTSLSPRELEVIQLIAESKVNKEIAEELGISIKTVEKHRQNLMSKLNIHDTAGLTRYSIDNGIIANGCYSKPYIKES